MGAVANLRVLFRYVKQYHPPWCTFHLVYTPVVCTLASWSVNYLYISVVAGAGGVGVELAMHLHPNRRDGRVFCVLYDLGAHRGCSDPGRYPHSRI